MKSIVIKQLYLDSGDVDKIKKWNAANTKNVGKLAEKLGVSRRFLYMLLKGEQKVSPRIYKKMLQLGIFEEDNV